MKKTATRWFVAGLVSNHVLVGVAPPRLEQLALLPGALSTQPPLHLQDVVPTTISHSMNPPKWRCQAQTAAATDDEEGCLLTARSACCGNARRNSCQASHTSCERNSMICNQNMSDTRAPDYSFVDVTRADTVARRLLTRY